jgi:hypothetical protein
VARWELRWGKWLEPMGARVELSICEESKMAPRSVLSAQKDRGEGEGNVEQTVPTQAVLSGSCYLSPNGPHQ